MVTYVHGLSTENTCNRVSWIWGCKPQSDATRTAGNVHMAAQAVMGTWLVAAIFFGVHVKPGATHNITMNGARIGMPAILPIAGHNMRFVSRTPMKELEHLGCQRKVQNGACVISVAMWWLLSGSHACLS